MSGRALVCHTRAPAFDRDSGSQDVDNFIRFLLEDGWSVTFLSRDPNPEPRHTARLRESGVATYAGFGQLEDLIRLGSFDLILPAFWEVAADVVQVARAVSPGSRVLIYSVDLHFLRDARRALVSGQPLDQGIGSSFVRELSTYGTADALIAVSREEADLLESLLGRAVYVVTPSDRLPRSTLPFDERRGMLFVGNFRHLPNSEAVRFLCTDVLPRMDAALLREHRLAVVGSWLDEATQRLASATPGVDVIGWAPDLLPYLHGCRLSLIPLLHGAGVKRKVIQSLMAGTPLITTRIGAEGLDLRHGEHAFVTDDAADIAVGVTTLLTDPATWSRLADAGWRWATERFDVEVAREAFRRAVHGTMAASRAHRSEDASTGALTSSRETAFARAVEVVVPPGSAVAILCDREQDVPRFGLLDGQAFPAAVTTRTLRDREDFLSAVDEAEATGMSHLAVPARRYGVFHEMPGLDEALANRYRKVYYDSSGSIYELRPHHTGRLAPGTLRPRVLVKGTYHLRRSGPPSDLTSALGLDDHAEVRQEWQPGSYADRPGAGASPSPDHDWTVFVDDRAIVPPGFIGEFAALADRLGVDRAQPAHESGPTASWPLTERVRGCIGRDITAVTEMPVLFIRGSGVAEAPVTLVDSLPVRLAPGYARAAPTDVDTLAVWSADREGRITRTQLDRSRAPQISVVIATYDRPGLLSACLESLTRQSLPPQAYEVVVIDDGSPSPDVQDVVLGYSERLPLVSVRIDHAGRSAAKNLGVLVATGQFILFFDDDDVARPEMLAEFLRGHAENPGDHVAILGYTEWSPTVERVPFLDYLVDVDGDMFSYGKISDGDVLDWRHFWEGRVSCSRQFLLHHGLHEQRLTYSVDVELARRLQTAGLRVVHRRSAVSHMERAPSVDDFCARMEAKGASQAVFAWLHPDEETTRYVKAGSVDESRASMPPVLPALRQEIASLEERFLKSRDPVDRQALWRAYRTLIDAHYAKGFAGMRRMARSQERVAVAMEAVVDGTPGPATPPTDLGSGCPLTVTIPVWSRTPELAEVAARTIDRIRDVSRMRTEIVVVDNGSPFQRDFDAIVHRFDENRGIAVAWNTGVGLASASTVAILNSDCLVQPGWDEALYEAATTGRRIAFPYTDHGDGRGFRRPDQAGTAGWCFMFTMSVFREIGPFDEGFSPAFCEDTDFFHRAWALGVELTPVPAAHVYHARRTTVGHDPHWEWLLLAHRYRYGWKHGVEPLMAPPFYDRPIIEYRPE